jgi:hypothetical protein
MWNVSDPAAEPRSRTTVPTRASADQSLADVQVLFRRTLACWASDVLALRQSGFTRPTWTGTPGSDPGWSVAA